MKDALKNPRIIILLFFVALSIIFIAPNPNPHGLKITYVSKDSSLNLQLGEIIYFIDNEPVTIESLNKEYFGTVSIQTNKGVRFFNVNGSLGLTAEPLEYTNLKFGLDLKGGVRTVIEPNVSDKDTIEQIISTLQTRINVYGLRESVFRPIYFEDKGFVEINIAGGNEEELRALLESQGKFEAKIPIILQFRNNESTLKLEKEYKIKLLNNSILIEDSNYKKGEKFFLDNTAFEVGDITKENINLTSTVFTSNDILIVFFDPQRSRIEKIGDIYRWSFAVQLSKEGAERFALITNNLRVVPGGYLDSPIILYLDGELIDSLSIASELKGKVVTEVSISGAAVSMDEAQKERSRLQSILRSGALPTSINIVQLETISPNLGTGFIRNAIIAAIAAILGVVTVVSLRYRKLKIILPMVLISLSEVLMILGFAALVGWTIDLSAIAGIIAAIGTGIDSQIIIIDQALRKEDERIMTLREKLSRAFFVIFGSAGTVIAAMLPLIIIGFGVLRGFAIVTSIGVLVGVLIARPAFAVIIEKII